MSHHDFETRRCLIADKASPCGFQTRRTSLHTAPSARSWASPCGEPQIIQTLNIPHRLLRTHLLSVTPNVGLALSATQPSSCPSSMALSGLAFMMAASASGRPVAPRRSFQRRTSPCFSCSLSGTRAAQQYVQPVPDLELLEQCLQHLPMRKSENAVVLLCSFPGTTAAYHALTESVDARLVMKAALYTATHPFVRLQKTGLSCILNSSLHSALSTCTL